VRASPLDGLPSSDRALKQSASFVPYAGRTYAAKRNFDFGVGQHHFVSNLSPDIRHQLITEHEVVATVLQRINARPVETFEQRRQPHGR
jgi:deoxyribodipyrimidine photo-lyase